MAGMGKRMRPHTLTVPKPLIPVAGKPIVQWLVEDLVKVCKEPVEEIAFVVGDFGMEVEDSLTAIAARLGARGSIYYQENPLGTAHAILCAGDSLTGKVIVAFADTLFRADFTIDDSRDGVIWVNRIEDPRMFGVVMVNQEGVITDFVEKPQTFVSDLAIIGIYYFRDGVNLKKELQYLIDNNVREKGEYQLTNALENMKQKGIRFVPGKVDEWLDCGNKDATVHTNRRVIEIHYPEGLISPNVKMENSVVIPPCYIGDQVVLTNSVIGPYVSAGPGCNFRNSVIANSIVQNHTSIKNAVIENSMIGHHAEFFNTPERLSMGDYSTHA